MALIRNETLDQFDAMREAREVPPPERAPLFAWMAARMRGIAPTRPIESERICEIAVAWLPEALDLVLDALRRGTDAARFSVICSFFDVPGPLRDELASTLAPAIFAASLAASDADEESVRVIAADVLPLFPEGEVERAATGEVLAGASDFFLSLLAKSAKARGRSLPGIASEIARRQAPPTESRGEDGTGADA